MRSDYDIMRIKREYGRDALTWSEQGRASDIEFDGVVGMGWIAAIIGVPLLVAQFIMRTVPAMPGIVTWVFAGLGVVFWAMVVAHWPRTGSAALAASLFAALLFGLGLGSPDYLYWDWARPLYDSGMPNWDGPLTAMVVMLAGSFAAIPLFLRVARPYSAIKDERYLRREPGPVMSAKPMSVLSSVAAMLPLAPLLPFVLWAGLFGPGGALSPAIPVSAGEALWQLVRAPGQVVWSGLTFDVFWPGGIGNSLLRLAFYGMIALTLVFSVFTARERRECESDARKARPAKPRPSETDEVFKSLRSIRARVALHGMIELWITADDIQDVWRIEQRIRASFPNLDFPFATIVEDDRLKWARKSSNGMGPHEARILALWIKKMQDSLTVPALEAAGYQRRKASRKTPRSKVSQHWERAQVAAG